MRSLTGTPAKAEVADRNTCKGYLVIFGMVENVHQGDQAAVAPADNPDAALIHNRIVFDHVIAGPIVVFDLQSAVVDEFVNGTAVACAPAVFRSNHNVALRHEFSDNMGVVGGEIPVHTPMRKDQEGIFFTAVDILRDKDVAVKLDRIFGTHGCGIFLMGIGGADDAHLVHMADITDAMKP